MRSFVGVEFCWFSLLECKVGDSELALGVAKNGAVKINK